MKKVLSIALIAAALLMSACSSENKTVENLKAATLGETSASTHYAAYAKKAAEEGHLKIAKMFEAASFAESRHAARHLAELAKLGVTDYVPEVASFEVRTTAENLQQAIAGEEQEYSKMYPEFIATAIDEKQDGAKEVFEWAKAVEEKHAGYYKTALESLTNPEVVMAGSWSVCPVCGDTYITDEAPLACKLCGAPVESFKVFVAETEPEPATEAEAAEASEVPATTAK